MHGPVAHAVDWTAVGVVVASALGWLPPLATILSIVWFSMQIVTWISNKNWKRK